ncbi:MAG TPA: hypothetical protein VIH93_07035, partial [Thermoanaerobaculia bacterium]
AIRFHERRERFARETRAYLLLRTRRRIGEELRARREEVYGAVAELVELQAGAAPGAAVKASSRPLYTG